MCFIFLFYRQTFKNNFEDKFLKNNLNQIFYILFLRTIFYSRKQEPNRHTFLLSFFAWFMYHEQKKVVEDKQTQTRAQRK